MLHNAKSRAKRLGVPFSLTLDDIRVPEFCPILGIRLRAATGRQSSASPSLDRIRPAEGYVPGNCIVISMRANQIKSDATAEELRKVAAFVEMFANT